MNVAEAVGRYFIFRFRRRQAAAGIRAVALQLKKWGVPLSVAWLILFGGRDREMPVLTDTVDDA